MIDSIIVEQALWSGAAYFVITFLAGFALGALRTLVVAPKVGETLAVLFEAPVILAVSWFVATWCVRRFNVPPTPLARLEMGGVAFALLMVAEAGMSLIVFQRTVPQYLAGYQSAAGAVGLAAQATFACVPLALTWRSWSALAVVRAIHTLIYLVMVTSIFAVLYAGITGVTGVTGPWLWLAAVLLGVESAVFLGNGLRCPLTAAAAHYGAGGGGDTFLPERITRHTFRVFGPLILIAAALAAARWGHWSPR